MLVANHSEHREGRSETPALQRHVQRGLRCWGQATQRLGAAQPHCRGLWGSEKPERVFSNGLQG